MCSLLRRSLLVVLLAGAAVLAHAAHAPEARAQEAATIELKPSQNDLNTTGVQAIVAGDFDAAIAAFKSSLALGEANVTYLNLGRALHKNGECKAALEAYDQAAAAPAVASPTRDEVAAVLERYRGEIDTAACPAFVTLACKPKSTEVSIDGDSYVTCPDKPIQLAPGEHEFASAFEGQTQTQTLTVAGMEEATLEIEFELAPPGGDDKGKGDVLVTKPEGMDQPPDTLGTDTQPGGISTLDILGFTALGLGVAGLGTAVILETTVLADAVEKSDNGTLTQADKDSAETIQGVNLGLYIAGGVLVTTGVVLLILPESDPSGSAHLVVPWANAEGGGIGYSARF